MGEQGRRQGGPGREGPWWRGEVAARKVERRRDDRLGASYVDQLHGVRTERFSQRVQLLPKAGRMAVDEAVVAGQPGRKAGVSFARRDTC